MKNIQQTTISTYTDPMLEAIIEKTHAECMANAKLLGQNDALKFKPPAKGSKLSVFTDSITTKYQALITKVNETLQGKLQLRSGASDKTEAETEIRDLTIEINNRRATASINRSNTDTTTLLAPIIGAGLCIILVTIIVSGEWIFLARSLQKICKTETQAYWLGLSIALGILIGSHYGEKAITKYLNNIPARRFARILLALVIFSLFLFLGKLRHDFLVDKHQPGGSILGFALLNWFLTTAAFLFIEMQLIPLISRIKEVWHDSTKYREFQRLNNEIEELEEQVGDLNKDLKDNLKRRMLVIAYQKALEQRIFAYNEMSISEYKRANLHTRTDGAIPECFNDQLPDLKSFTQDIEI